MVASLAASIGTILIFGKTILQSEFWSMVSLVFSDWQIVVINFYDFAYSLLETLPVLAIAIILVPLFTLFLSADVYFGLNNNKHKFI
jgi:hypothetical protein